MQAVPAQCSPFNNGRMPVSLRTASNLAESVYQILDSQDAVRHEPHPALLNRVIPNVYGPHDGAVQHGNFLFIPVI